MTTDDARRTLLQRTRETFATYLCLRAELRSHGVSEAYLATLEAGEHAAWDLQHVMWDEAASTTAELYGPTPMGIDVSGNLILGP